jgi:hypothetical protein
VQLARSVGAAVGTALFSTVVFASLFWGDPAASVLFERVVDLGPSALTGLAGPARDAFVAHVGQSFRAGFLLVAAFTTIGCVFAWLNPTRRL